MAQSNGGENLFRAICNATADAEDHDHITPTSKALMQAVHLDGYIKSLDEVKAVDVPRPNFESYLALLKQIQRPVPKEPLVHVRITHTAINHVDLLYAHGVHQNNKSGLFVPPFTLGLEFSGVVLQVHAVNGQKPTFKPGDKVWGGSVGTHAEEIIVPASAIHHLPNPTWSLHDIAAIGAGTLPVSYGALTTIAGLSAGEVILVHAAAGGLGVYAVQIARALGAKVIGTVGSQHKAAVVESLLRDPNTGKIPAGEGVVNYSKGGWENEVLALCKQIGKDGIDVVYDTVGLVQKSIRCTTFNGRIVVAGFAGRTGTGAEKVQALEQLAVNRILLKQIKLLGYRYGETNRRMPQETVKMWRGLNEMLIHEPRLVHPVVYKTYKGLSHINEGMQALRHREVYGKAVIEVCTEELALKQAQQVNNQQQASAVSKL
ncbi:hypothetical protein LTR64_003952 [Lithohypha guttulata]|uniref:uncharacterized protein n=1 Tax=Lithohypha guttulata TaxID=1690604 RepID=UPI002DE0F2DA|nr:hypothetical protein LTR51_006990 [Lithohypha guttulata]